MPKTKKAKKTIEVPAQELPSVQIEAKKPASIEPKPIRFAKGTKVRYRPWDKPDGPLDKTGTVTGHGPKWITIMTEAGKTDWSIPGRCEAVNDANQTA